jgi:hypothetical protein
MAIDVEEGSTTVTPSSRMISKLTQTGQIISRKKSYTVVEAESITGLDAAGNLVQSLVV